jgi:hypothetical protein
MLVWIQTLDISAENVNSILRIPPAFKHLQQLQVMKKSHCQNSFFLLQQILTEY